MIGWGALVGLAGQAVGQWLSKKNNEEQQQMADAAAARQEAHYEAKAAENPLARSENQALLNEYDRGAKKQVETARNVAAITGATPEYSVSVQEGVAQGRADLMGQMAAGASRRADAYEQKAEAVRAGKEAADLERKAARQQTYANLISNAATAMGNIMDSYSEKVAPEQAPVGGVTKGGSTIVAPVGGVTKGGSTKVATATPHTLYNKDGSFRTSYKLTGTGLNPEKVTADTSGLTLNLPQYQQRYR